MNIIKAILSDSRFHVTAVAFAVNLLAFFGIEVNPDNMLILVGATATVGLAIIGVITNSKMKAAKILKAEQEITDELTQ